MSLGFEMMNSYHKMWFSIMSSVSRNFFKSVYVLGLWSFIQITCENRGNSGWKWRLMIRNGPKCHLGSFWVFLKKSVFLHFGLVKFSWNLYVLGLCWVFTNNMWKSGEFGLKMMTNNQKWPKMPFGIILSVSRFFFIFYLLGLGPITGFFK